MTEQRREPLSRPVLVAAVLSALLGVVAPNAASLPGATVLGVKVVKDPPKDDKTKDKESKKDFTISGQASGLYPGASRPLVLTLANGNNFAIRVTVLAVAVANASTACAGTNVRVAPLATPVVVPANGTTTTTLTARMANNPPNACRNATFGLTYSGTAEKA
jgi:hypothetical protein